VSAGDDQRRDPGSDGTDAPEKRVAGVSRASGNTVTAGSRSPCDHADHHGTNGEPRWRQIEIMRERRALKELLDDIDADDLEYEEEVFGSEEEREAYYRAVGEELEEDEEEPLDLEDEDDFEEEE